MNRAEAGRKNRLGNMIIIALCIVLACAIIYGFGQFMGYERYRYDTGSFYYSLQSGQYSQMVSMYYNNQSSKGTDSDDIEPYYAVARYFEAASFYKAYMDAGETEAAEKRRIQMEEAAGQMEVFAPEADKIDALLGIE